MTLPTSTTGDVAAAVERVALASCSPTGTATPVHHRAAVVLAFRGLLLEGQGEVVDLIQWETGKGRLHAWQEIVQVTTIARRYARRAGHYLADKLVRGVVYLLTKVKDVRVPKGVIGIISPWNSPLYLGVGDVLPALLAGNAVVSRLTRRPRFRSSGPALAEAGLAADLWQVVTGAGSVIGSALIVAVDDVCFTGSTATWRSVEERAARRADRGRHSSSTARTPLIVRADADIEKAAARTATARFANTGKICISIARVYVPWTADLKRQTKELADFRAADLTEYGGHYTRMRVTRSGRTATETLTTNTGEFPQHDLRRTMGKHHFSYLACVDGGSKGPNTIVMLDHNAEREIVHRLPRHHTVCEPILVPRSQGAAEGNGWLLTVGYDPDQHRSRLIVLDASNLEADLVFVGHLRHHVPQTFHGSFTARVVEPGPMPTPVP